MVADAVSSESNFNLFDAEERALAAAEDLALRLPADVQGDIGQLIESYGLAIREQRRLVRFSDRQQSQVATLYKELFSRTRQAERALDQLRQAQAQLVQAQKLASLGALVGGVAHEINTPVGVALSCSTHLGELIARLRRNYQADDVGVQDFEDFLDQATQAADLLAHNCQRAAELIGSFKQVAVDRVWSERQRFELDKKITETVVSLGPGLKASGHELRQDCLPGIQLDGYPGALSQIINNLILNAITHAFPDKSAGEICIRAHQQDDGWIELVFADNGQGIAPEHLEQVFDPFFTTRMGQGGSGLGLNIVYNLVTGSLGGTIAVTSQPGQGTQFLIRFPATAPLPQDGA